MRTTFAILLTLLLIGCSKPSNDNLNPAPGFAESSGSADGGGSDAATAQVENTAAPSSGEAQGEPTPVPIESGVAALNENNTTIQFVGTHAGEKPDPRTGVFAKFTGKVEVDSAAKTIKSVSVDIQADSLETAIPKLTTHLRSPDFLDARENPLIKFESTSVESGEGENVTVIGKLTLMKTTKEVRLPAKATINDSGITMSGSFTIDRTEYGMTGQEGVNKEVELSFSVGQKTQSPQQPAAPSSAATGGKGRRGGGKFDPVALFKRSDADGDGKLSGEEISERLRNDLKEVDKDGDGSVSQEEFLERMKNFGRNQAGKAASGDASTEKPAEPAATEENKEAASKSDRPEKPE